MHGKEVNYETIIKVYTAISPVIILFVCARLASHLSTVSAKGYMLFPQVVNNIILGAIAFAHCAFTLKAARQAQKSLKIWAGIGILLMLALIAAGIFTSSLGFIYKELNLAILLGTMFTAANAVIIIKRAD